MNVAQAINMALIARTNCEQSGNTEWLDKWNERLAHIERNALPSGSGFNSGTSIDRDKSDTKRITFNTSYHHMNDCGMYDGSTEHTVTIRPLFNGFSVTVSGRNRNDIKDYIGDVFHDALSTTYEWQA